MTCDETVFTTHALRRMFARGISHAEVSAVLAAWRVIEDYPDDEPFPSVLLLGAPSCRPVHVVAARDADARRCYIVTAYVPDPGAWSADFTQRTSP